MPRRTKTILILAAFAAISCSGSPNVYVDKGVHVWVIGSGNVIRVANDQNSETGLAAETSQDLDGTLSVPLPMEKK